MGLQDSFTYDVYLSFRGEDTRFGFTSYLYAALNQRGIRTFMDDAALQQGEEIASSVSKAIIESRIFIIIFSENYASSSWCLDELTKILECYEEKKTGGRSILPVFYKVEPSDVRKWRGSYGGVTFAKHEKRFPEERVNRWRNSLRKAAEISGFHYRMGGYEYKFIEDIVKEVCRKVSLHVADYPVGLESQVDKVKSLLNLESDDAVHMVGIHGIGGIGKTTIARAVYNSIGCQFEGLCFLEEVRVNSIKFGLEHLQKIVLSKICHMDINIGCVTEGIPLIKKRLQKKKVLLVLDDVDKLMQLQVIAGSSDWFGLGSRVIITTRDKDLLARHGVEFKRTYEVEELSKKEALNLLSWNAFKTDIAVDPSYAHVLKRVLTYASRVQLALKVLCPNLFALDQYEKIRDKNIQSVLKSSFDSLDIEEQRIFCDIACFFNGHKLAEVEDILGSHYGLSVKDTIGVLVDKSIMKIDDGLVTSNDLIEDMGREIVRQESLYEPEKYSRLWFPQDVVHVLQENSGSSTIESLLLDFPNDGINSNGVEVNWDGQAFKNMQKLGTLAFRNGRFINKGATDILYRCPSVPYLGNTALMSLPANLKQLVILKLPESSLRISKPIQVFKSLTVLDFSYCEWIHNISDVSGLPNLQNISFKHCENLTQIHESVGLLEKLRIFDVDHCKKLRALPPIRLSSLEQLDLSHCSVLESFPEILGKMENVTELHIMENPIQKLPYSIQNLVRLRKLELYFCGTVWLPKSIVMLPELSLMCVSYCQRLWFSKQDKGEELESRSSKTEHLILSYCNISNDLLPIVLTWFANVKDLDLSGNNFEILHASIKECPFLKNLKLDGCKNIEEIKELPWKLESLSAKQCTSLKYLEFTGECPSSIRKLILDGCSFLYEVKGVLPNLDNFSAKNCTSLNNQSRSMIMNQESVEVGIKMISLPGTEIPDWFTHHISGESISFWFRGKFPAISLCLVIGLVGEKAITVNFIPRVFINGKKLSIGNWEVHEFMIATDHILLFDISLLKFEDDVFSDNNWNHVVFSYVDHINNNGVPIKVVAKYSGIHVSQQRNAMADIRFTNPLNSLQSVNLNANSMEAHKRVQITAERPQKDQAKVLSSSILSSTQLRPPFPDVRKGPDPKLIVPAKSSLEDVIEETSMRLQEEETIPNDPPVIQSCSEGDDIEQKAVSSSELESEESSCKTESEVFYGVDPSDVRNGRESYSEALAKHEERFNEWRTLLRKGAELAGFLHSPWDAYESEFIDTIVKKVYSKVSRVSLHVADYPVGLESRVDKVNSLLNLGSDDVVHMVGIHGIGGIGKTTIARAVYNSIRYQFEGLCFLEDVRENSMKFGLEHLQETMLSKVYGDGDINIQNAKEVVSMMREGLRRKKILLILDDVDKMEQLQAIAGASDWFGSGSRVIITTRDKYLLVSHVVERTYEVEALSEKESLDLLSWNAFQTNKIDPCYADIAKRVLTFASGLPLALRVVGSLLFGRSIYEWRSSLDQYERFPEIQMELKISYDSLEEEEKRIFLDIACFFNGHKLEGVKDILSALYGASVKYSIEELIEKSLIKIDDGFVTLHNLIQDMGREIVRQESPYEPGKRSRLWFPQDVVHVLQENSGSSTIESLFLDFPKDEVNPNGSKSKEVYWDGDALKKMQKLRVLVIKSGCFNKGPTHLPNSLKVLKWPGYPSSSLPNDFHPKELAILKLPASCMAVTEPIQRFISLKVLNFSNCELVTRIPDVSGLPNLEKLSFRDCMNLSKIHESVGFLDKLTILDVCHCKKLRTLPPIILTSLEQLNLSHCSALESFPEILGKMENLTELCIIESPIKHLPFSIKNLNGLQKLELQNCGMVQLPSSIAMFSQLYLMCVSRCEGLWLSKQDVGEEWETKSSKTEHLMLSYCNLSDDFLPIGVTWFPNVKDLDLSGSNFTILHACIKECYSLRNLKLDDCVLIREITVLPWKLETFSAKRCKSLKYMDITGECLYLRELILDDCIYLQEIKGILPNLDHFSVKNCTLLTSQCASMLVNQEMIEAGNKMFSLPGTKIPDWFSHCTSGESISFWYCNKFPAISLCLVIGVVDELPISVKFSPKVFINGNELSSGNQQVYEFRVAMDHILLFDARLLKFENNGDTVFSDKELNHVVVSYEDLITDNGVPIREVAKYSGIHVFNQTSGLEDIRFIDSQQKLLNVNLDPNSMLGLPQSGKIMTKRSQEDQTMTLSHKVTSAQSPSPPSEAETGLVPQPTFLVKMALGDVGREAFESLSDNEIYATSIQNYPPIIQRCSEGDDVELESLSCEEESSSNTEGSDSDDPFDLVDRKLSVSGKETLSSGASSGDANLRSIKDAINALELLIVKDLSEVSADPAAQSKLHQLLDLLSASDHPKVTVEVKEAVVEFKRKAFASFQEFQATVESVNKLKDFESHLARIRQETVAGKGRRKDLKNSIKKVSSAIITENSRKKDLEIEISTLRIELSTKERDLKQLVLNLKNQEESLSTYSTSYASLNEKARALLEEADDLLAASSGVKHEGEAAEVKQNTLKSAWCIDLTNQFNKIKNNIIHLL